jgi:HEXXH motif-containing protein
VAGYALLETAMRSNNPVQIERRIDRFSDRHVSAAATRVLALGRRSLASIESSDLKEVLSGELARSGQNSDIFDPTDAAAVDRSLAAVDQALSAIKLASPTLGDEIAQLVTDIVIIDSTKTNAASSFQTFGVIVLKYLQPFQTWTTYVEHITHEAAHHLLFALFAEHDVFKSGNQQRYKSPLRSDLRPLDGVFHAMFVLARIIYILRRVRDSNAFPDFRRTATYSFYNPSSLIDQFRDSFNVIAANAQLTNFGVELLESTRAFAETYAFNEEPLVNWANR